MLARSLSLCKDLYIYIYIYIYIIYMYIYIYKDLYIQYTQLLIGDNDLNNHNDYCSCNVIAKLQTYKNKK